jgi:hypothetical protein
MMEIKREKPHLTAAGIFASPKTGTIMRIELTLISTRANPSVNSSEKTGNCILNVHSATFRQTAGHYS